MRKFSVNQVKEAYESAAVNCNRFYQLTTGVKLEMCKLLDCDPIDLERWFQRASKAQFQRAIF